MPSLVLDPSFPSTTAVSSERAPAEASDDIVGVDDLGDTQQSTPIRGGVASDYSENEGGKGDSGGVQKKLGAGGVDEDL